MDCEGTDTVVGAVEWAVVCTVDWGPTDEVVDEDEVVVEVVVVEDVVADPPEDPPTDPDVPTPPESAYIAVMLPRA